MNSLISICMATYNGEQFIASQLDSILNQTYKNFELIIQDDCSNDNTINIIKQFTEQLNIKLFINEQNIGYTKNFESVIQKAQGDFIALCDQDDIWEKNKLEVLINNIKNNSLVYSDSLLIDHNGDSLNKTLSQKLKNKFISSRDPLNFLYDNCVSAHALLFSSDIKESIIPFPQNIYFDQWIAANAAGKNGVNYIDLPLIKYRQHNKNTLGNKKKKNASTTSKIKNKIQKNKMQTKIYQISCMTFKI